MTRAAVHEDVVVLVPGFLGFSILGRFPYFADRIPGALAALVREKLGHDVSVVPATTVPAGRLQDRVLKLARFLAELSERGARRFRLIGHSTGGVDAQLLMAVRPFWGGDWSAEVQDRRKAVLSVVTISAPHFGTAILESPAARFLEHPNLEGVLPFFRAAGPLLSLAIKDMSQIHQILNLSATQAPDVSRFIFSVMQHHELLDELRPASMEALRSRTEVDPRVKPTCFLTGADVIRGGPRPSDAFYAEIAEFCRMGTRLPASAAVLANIEAVRAAPATAWIRDPESVAFNVDLGTSDGVVNTARQLLPEGALGGIVVGDHADVIGDYDRIDIANDDEPLSTGIFRSGAGFGDDQFVQLYRSVVEAL
jgi:pimeloyl-ACP methyl ester carboxylesterase